MDPELARAAQLYRRVDHADPATVRREAARRRKVSLLIGEWATDDPDVQVQDVVVPTADGSPVTVRVYRPVGGAEPRPAVLYLHGGAFISGDLDFEHPRCLEMCRETECIVASADYRLAPESPYPAGLDDGMLAFRWLCGPGGASWGVDPTRVAVAGTSAGGALAAALCLRARDLGINPPRLQLLLFPVTDDRLRTWSVRAFTDTPVWDHQSCVHMWHHYLGPAEGRGVVSPYAAPARAGDLSRLPAAYVLTAEYDPLRDEGVDYARRLLEDGVPTELHQFPRAFHGFDTLAAATPVAHRARREVHDVLRAAL